MVRGQPAGCGVAPLIGSPWYADKQLLDKPQSCQRERRLHQQICRLRGPSLALRRRLQSLAGGLEKGAVSFDPGIVLKTGTTLVRQWRGHTHTVLVRDGGFEYEGQRYRSLTVIAEQITGAHWSGPRFFGVTRRARASLPVKAGE